MARFNITLPDSLKEQLQRDAQSCNTASSTLVADYIKEHYDQASAPDPQEQISKLKRQHEDEMSYTKQEYERQLKKLQDALQLCKDAGWELQQNQIGEIEQLRIQYEAKCDERCAEYQSHISKLESSIDELEKTLRNAETNNLNLMAKLRAQSENHERALADQEHRHKDVLEEEARRCEKIATAMRYEQELTQAKLEATQLALQVERDHILELRNDKVQLQKQLDLVTLRLPAPKEDLFSRIFGRKKKDYTE